MPREVNHKKNRELAIGCSKMEVVGGLGQEQYQDKWQKPNCSGSRKTIGGEEVTTVIIDSCLEEFCCKAGFHN